MSKYTTELRFICETYAGLKESVGYSFVQNVIEEARPLLFDFDYPIFDENYKSVLETKIIKHFYTREIGFETVGLFKLKLDMKMNEIMPYYNKLYESELLEFNPLYTMNYTKEHHQRDNGNNSTIIQEIVGTNESEGYNHSANNSTTGNRQIANVDTNLYSDTPQGDLTGIDDKTYLTNANKNTVNGSENNTTTEQQQAADTRTRNKTDNKSGNEAKTFTSTNDYTDSVSGYDGRNASKLIEDFRKTLLNIDMQIINDLETLFMGIW